VPTFEDLVALLSEVHITDRKRYRAHTVASHLVSNVLGVDRWNQLSDQQTDQLIAYSTNRLWNIYMNKRRNQGQQPKEAANAAILEEWEFLRYSLK
jgi:hypothetical protein